MFVCMCACAHVLLVCMCVCVYMMYAAMIVWGDVFLCGYRSVGWSVPECVFAKVG